jgi:hypothetical protein
MSKSSRIERPLPTDNEVAWSKFIAFQLGGEAEVRTPDGSRCDIVAGDYAIEVEWCKKQSQAPGQALLYAATLMKKPKVILLTRGKKTEEKYFLRCLVACLQAGIELTTFNTIKEGE